MVNVHFARVVQLTAGTRVSVAVMHGESGSKNTLNQTHLNVTSLAGPMGPPGTVLLEADEEAPDDVPPGTQPGTIIFRKVS